MHIAIHPYYIMFRASTVDVLKAAQSVKSEELETAKNKISELTQSKNKTIRVSPLYIYIHYYVCVYCDYMMSPTFTALYV